MKARSPLVTVKPLPTGAGAACAIGTTEAVSPTLTRVAVANAMNRFALPLLVIMTTAFPSSVPPQDGACREGLFAGSVNRQ
jgi:hypothetical protein